MDFASFADWALKGLLAGILGYGIHILGKMRDSMEALNVRLAVVIEKTMYHDKELDKHGQQIARIEERLPKKRGT